MSMYEGVGFSNSASIPDDLFLLNPFNQKTVSGRLNIGYALRRFGCVGALITLFSIFMIGLTIPSFLTEYRLATLKTGQTKGEVVDHRVSRGKSTTYYVTYQFTLNDHIYKREDSVSSGSYNSYEVGGNIPVTYVVDDPTTAHIGENGIHWNSMLPLFCVGGFFLIFFGVAFIAKLPQYRRFRRMRREGQLILGELKNNRGQLVTRGSGKNRRTDFDITIYCQFVNLSGKKIDAHATVTRNDLKKKELQTNGSVAVLYVSDSDYLVL